MPLDFTPTIFKSFCIISVTDFIPFLETVGISAKQELSPQSTAAVSGSWPSVAPEEL